MPIDNSHQTMSDQTETAPQEWDLTNRVSPFLDRHMMFPLLEFLDNLIAEKTISYASSDIQAARVALLRPTKMVDYTLEIVTDASLTAELEQEKAQVLKQLETLQEGAKSLVTLTEDEEQVVRVAN